MGLAYPRSRRGMDSHGDEMAGVLEGVDEWVDVWREAMGGGSIVIDNLFLSVLLSSSTTEIALMKIQCPEDCLIFVTHQDMHDEANGRT